MSMNPAELAFPIAEDAMRQGRIQGTYTGEYEVEPFEDLNELARFFGLLNRPYEGHTVTALALPAKEDSRSVPWRFDELDFTGELESYNAVRSPVELGRLAINGVCLTFQNVVLLPYGERVRGVRLHVPPYSIEFPQEPGA